VLIDTAKSFVYTEGGLKGVLMASRLSGLSPNLTSRFTPGTLISSYEVYEALRRGVAVPFRKRDAEGIRNISELRASDKGGMIFQPEPGVYEKVHQIDFTSLYPSIIVKYNLSPETIEHPERTGFLASVLSSLLNLRIETKRLKKTNKDYAGIDSVLKWMLVTCFGYTGYRNAKFGQIQVHERITETSRELLMQIKEMARREHGLRGPTWHRGLPVGHRRAYFGVQGGSREGDRHTHGSGHLRLDHLPAHERRRRSLQPLFWQAEHWQDEDPGSDGPQGRYSCVCQQDAAGGLRSPGRGQESRGSQTDRTQS
jgi:hypothetical protein